MASKICKSFNAVSKSTLASKGVNEGIDIRVCNLSAFLKKSLKAVIKLIKRFKSRRAHKVFKVS